MTPYEKLIAEKERRADQGGGDARSRLIAERERRQAGKPLSLRDKVDGLAEAFTEGATFGLVGDEARAKVSEWMGRGSYDANLSQERAGEERMRADHPYMTMGAEVVGGLAPGAGLVGGVARGATLAGRMGLGLAGGAAGGAVYGAAEGEGGFNARAEGALQGGAVGGVIGGATPALGQLAQKAWRGTVGKSAARRALPGNTATSDDLVGQARGLYDQARSQGVTAQQDATQGLAAQTRAIAQDAGLISPTGRIAESYPRVRDALAMVDDFAEGTMDPAQMQAVRRTFQGVAQSSDPAERRLGTKMLEQFDNFVEPLAPEFKQANALYSRAKKGEIIDEAIELAGVRAGQFSGSGYENALRTEFRRLSRDIVKGKLKGLTADQEAAIRRVAEGGSLENMARDLGKAAPTGIVSVGIGGGLPFMVGNAIGGPGVGAAAGAATLGLGAAGRKAATSMQSKNANYASALMRSASGSTPTADPQSGTALSMLLQSYLLGQSGRLDPREALLAR